MAQVDQLTVKDAAGVNRDVATLTAIAALIGEVQASPSSNTLLDRLKAIQTALVDAATEAKQDDIVALLTTGLSQPGEIVGSISAGATDSGKPVKGGAVYNTSIPTYTAGQRTDLQSDQRGALKITQMLADSITPVPQVIFNVYRLASSAASTNATSARTSAGYIGKIMAFNTNAAVRYLKLYNKASAPTVGTDTPFVTVPLAPGMTDISFAKPLYMTTGIAYGLTTGAADADTGAVGSGDITGLAIIA